MWVGVRSCSRAKAISGSTGPPASTNSASAPSPRATRYVLVRKFGSSERSISIGGSLPGRMPDQLIHTCYRIGDIDRSVEFYEKLGFEEIGRLPIRDEAINVFMGLPGDGARLELTYNHGVDHYELGTGYNHIAVTVTDLDA